MQQHLTALVSVFVFLVVIISGIPATAGPITDGLVAHYKLDDDGTSTAIDSVGSSHGINNGATPGVTGQWGSGFEFDGVSDFVSVNPFARPEHEELTISLWAKGTGTFLSAKTPEYENYLGYVVSLDQAYYHTGLYTVGGHLEVDTTMLGDLSGNFHHFLLRATQVGADSHMVEMFIDGWSVGTSTRADKIPSWSNIELGRNVVEANGHFDGVLDDVGIWSRAVTNSEVEYLSLNPIPEPNTALLLGFGLVGLGVKRRRRQAVLH